MEPDFITLTPETLPNQHLCCIIRSKKPHPGVEAKRRWLADRLPEGHVFRKLDVKEKVFIEYAPLETAWVPVEGDNYLYLYCLWVAGAYKGQGYGRALLESCLEDARAQGQRVTIDAYPWTAGASQLYQYLPPDFQDGGYDAACARMADPVQRAKLTEILKHPQEDFENAVKAVGARSRFLLLNRYWSRESAVRKTSSMSA